MTDAAREIMAIEARVRPTICPTFGTSRETGQPTESLEGRISAPDFERLVALANATAQVEAAEDELAHLGRATGAHPFT